MVITYSKILTVYKNLLDGKMTFDEADRWAYGLTKLNDERKLIYEPNDKESEMWELIMYLFGIDMPSFENLSEPMTSMEDIKNFLTQKNINISEKG